ncbi:hypothetical protein OIU78_030410 [Salix suchowensis]|nr:hypothetical protein OIU78_030410 [Salix suchowensis]
MQIFFMLSTKIIIFTSSTLFCRFLNSPQDIIFISSFKQNKYKNTLVFRKLEDLNCTRQHPGHV